MTNQPKKIISNFNYTAKGEAKKMPHKRVRISTVKRSQKVSKIERTEAFENIVKEEERLITPPQDVSMPQKLKSPRICRYMKTKPYEEEYSFRRFVNPNRKNVARVLDFKSNNSFLENSECYEKDYLEMYDIDEPPENFEDFKPDFNSSFTEDEDNEKMLTKINQGEESLIESLQHSFMSYKIISRTMHVTQLSMNMAKRILFYKKLSPSRPKNLSLEEMISIYSQRMKESQIDQNSHAATNLVEEDEDNIVESNGCDFDDCEYEDIFIEDEIVEKKRNSACAIAIKNNNEFNEDKSVKRQYLGNKMSTKANSKKTRPKVAIHYYYNTRGSKRQLRSSKKD